ncbi:MAG TPA: hypothetical protein VFM97_11745 [Gammaproteobacteria bacterium]|nr:hypothetical protein [Gammaproteobacteria bacterium]
MEMKEGWGDIVGRRVVGVFLHVRGSPAKSQMLLAFDDGTSFEFRSREKSKSATGCGPAISTALPPKCVTAVVLL